MNPISFLLGCILCAATCSYALLEAGPARELACAVAGAAAAGLFIATALPEIPSDDGWWGR